MKRSEKKILIIAMRLFKKKKKRNWKPVKKKNKKLTTLELDESLLKALSVRGNEPSLSSVLFRVHSFNVAPKVLREEVLFSVRQK